MLWCLVGRERICVVLWLTQVCIDEGAVADRVRWWHGATGGGVITRRGYWLPLVVADLLAMDGIKDGGCWARLRSGWLRHRRVDLEVATWKRTVLTSTDPQLGKLEKDDIPQEGILSGPLNKSIVNKEYKEVLELYIDDQKQHSPSIEVPPELKLKQLPAHL
ncbi:unnamed protein product [Vicia faba]|uniref:Uncharacterized protein n=1 Tax=Vicia faba TaxID=3906 RepID=A0AAV1BAH6_VICFA|nr:unnamed protein product [Vicia faba]